MRTLLRRDFLKGLALLPAAFRLRDKFGGCPDVRFNGTGFFRLEKKDRWWLVTPEGNAFLSFGLNHVTPGLLRRPQCIDHWTKTFGARDASDVRQFAAGYAQKVREDLAALGMNTLGVHSSLRDLPSGAVPYIHTARFVDICHYMTPSESDFLDVFSPAFESHCDRVAQSEVLPRKDDAWLIGYFMTDCPVFTDLDAAPRQQQRVRRRSQGIAYLAARIEEPRRVQPRETSLHRGDAGVVWRRHYPVQRRLRNRILFFRGA